MKGLFGGVCEPALTRAGWYLSCLFRCCFYPGLWAPRAASLEGEALTWQPCEESLRPSSKQLIGELENEASRGGAVQSCLGC